MHTLRRLLSPAGFAGILAGLITLSFADVLFFGRSFFFRDFGIFGYPLAYYHRESFWRGEIPLWNPLNNCGLPFLAQWNSLTLYPPSLIYLLLPLPWSLNLFCLLHLFWAGFGMYMLARRWTTHPLAPAVAGVIFAFNGLTQSALMWPNNIAALGWAPWVLLAVDRALRGGRRAAVQAILFGALQMLSGAPEVILFTWVIAALPVFTAGGVRPLARFIGIAAGVAAAAAMQLLPFLQLLSQSDRTATFGVNSWSMPPWGWLNLLDPLFRTYRSPLGVYFQQGQDWTSSYYLGAGTLGLVFIGLRLDRSRRMILLVSACAFGLLMALGPAGLLYTGVLKILPLGFMRFPIKFVLLPILTAPLLAALAIDALAARISASKNTLRILRGTALVLVAALAAVIGFTHQFPFPHESFAAVLTSGIARIVAVIALFALLLAAAGEKPLAALFVVAIFWLDLISIDPLTWVRQNPSIKSEALAPGLLRPAVVPFPEAGAARVLMSRESHDLLYRNMLPDGFNDYLGRRLGLFGNVNLLEGLPAVDGFYSLYLPAPRQVWASAFFAPSNAIPAGLLDFLSVTHVNRLSDPNPWQVRSSALPFITAGQKPVFASADEILVRLAEPGFDSRKIVYLPLEARGKLTASNASPTTLSSVRFSAHRITLEAAAPAPALLVIGQSHYPAWQATVDQQATPLWPGNHGFQVLELPAGKHRIEVVYRDRAFLIGGAISALTLLGCAWGWGRRPDPVQGEV